jgi:hypothetical protein
MGMRLSLLSVMIVAGLLIAPEPYEAAAIPVMPAATRIIPAMAGGSIAKVYYYPIVMAVGTTTDWWKADACGGAEFSLRFASRRRLG